MFAAVDDIGGGVVPLPSRSRNLLIGAAAMATLGVLSVAAAVVGLHGDGQHPVADPVASVPVDSPSPTPSPTPSPIPPPAPTVSPSPTRKATTPPKKKAPPPAPKPITVAKPPPPPPPGRPPGPSAPPSGATCPKLTGTPAPRPDVGAAMSAAAGKAYKPTLSLDDTNPPAISVRPLLVQGIGWEESGWQSTILACDGGYGTMQVMPDTASWMNQKYGTSYDRMSLSGNVNVATGYLAWLTRYFGDRYFNRSYDLSGSATKIVLLDMVISAYQAGFGAVDNAMTAGTDLPNRWYVDTVEGFMAHAPWSGS
jgi:Transglycosylase SLT domain